MRGVFTVLVRSLGEGGHSGEEEIEAAWTALRKALARKLRARSMWSASPAYLGVFGAVRWEGEALDELLADCWKFVFIDRLRGLRAQLKVLENIEGLVHRNVSNFLYETQKRNDPLGFRVFTTLQQALRQAIARGTMRIVAGPQKVGNETVLTFESPAESIAEPHAVDLGTIVRPWAEALLPDLVAADGRGREAVVADLRELLEGLPGQGVGSFRVKEIIDPLKVATRERWVRMCQLPSTAADSTVPAALALEERQTFAHLGRQIADAIERLEESRPAKRELHRLWRFLTCFAADTEGAENGALPSYRRLGELLGIPRKRLPKLFETLGQMVLAHRGGSSRQVTADPRLGGPAHGAERARPAQE